MSLQVKVITPEKIIWNTESDEVVLPTVTGDLGVLTGHAPLVSVLEAGLLRKKK
jgi:F-type H+-transporting ATPase subunit epsilon